MEDIMKKVKSLEDFGLLITGISEAMINEETLLETLGASLLGNLLTGKGTIRAGKGTIRAGEIF